MPQIIINQEIKKILESWKIHKREPIGDVVEKLVKEKQNSELKE